MTIDWATLTLEAINFGILAWLLHRFLFKPVMGLIEKRRRQEEALRAEAEQARQAAEREAAAWHDRMAGLEDERRKIIREARTRIDEERAKVLEEARAEAARLLEAGRHSLAGDRVAALEDLRGEIGRLSVDLAGRLLDQTASPCVAEAFLGRLEDRLATLAIPAGSTAEIATAPALGEKAQARWRERLGGRFGAVVFTEAPDLIAGARLSLPGATLELSWRAALEEARKELIRDEPAA